jgi:hypothetical protein
MDQDDVESAIETQRPHVPHQVLAPGIDHATHRQHGGRDVGERQPKSMLEVGGEAAAPGAQLEQSGALAGDLGVEPPQQVFGLAGVLLGRREERPPGGELVVESQRSGPAHGTRAKAMVQFVSQLLPPSAEYACSQRHASDPCTVQTKRLRMCQPSNGSWA